MIVQTLSHFRTYRVDGLVYRAYKRNVWLGFDETKKPCKRLTDAELISASPELVPWVDWEWETSEHRELDPAKSYLIGEEWLCDPSYDGYRFCQRKWWGNCGILHDEEVARLSPIEAPDDFDLELEP